MKKILSVILLFALSLSLLTACAGAPTPPETEPTEGVKKPVMNICLNYGARQELCHAFNHIIESGISRVTPQDIDNALYTKLPPLDLIIRTGGEKRLSNFMLWQAVYAELYFTDVLWPDFNEDEFDKAIEGFGARERRFGKV